MTEPGRLMRIRELAEATGVSAQTIHYYLREGLLPPPTKTSPNMAYYAQGHVEDILLIKELQAKRYLPLSLIKLVLDAKRQGKYVSDVQDMRLTLEDIFRPLAPDEEIDPVSLMEMVVMAGLPAETVERLEGLNLLTPTVTTQGKRYDGLDVRIARGVKKLLDLGLVADDFKFFQQYVAALWQTIQVIHERVFLGPAGSQAITGSQVRQDLVDLKAALDAKTMRRAALEMILPAQPPLVGGRSL